MMSDITVNRGEKTKGRKSVKSVPDLQPKNIAAKKKTIIYIAGEGFSGTTLLDAILGNQKDAFSTGELMFFAQKGIQNQEYCSCHKTVPNCEIWSEIIKEWEKKRVLSLEEYIKIQNKLTSMKNVLFSYLTLRNPDRKVADFLKDTKALYETIFQLTGSATIVDSSKAPSRIPILKKLGYELQIVHAIRRFGHVLNSYKKSRPKDLKNGVEHEMVPLKSSYVLSSWTAKNVLTIMFSKGIFYRRVKYKNVVARPLQALSNWAKGNKKFSETLSQRGPFYLDHLVAGNQIRMKDHIFIANKPMNTSYHRLNKMDKVLARVIDYFY